MSKLKAVEVNFLKFLQSPSQFAIPVYQRKYSWTKKQCMRLLLDVENAGKDSDNVAHFTGSVVYITKDVFHAAAINSLNVIDGQQRLTTVSLMILALQNSLIKTGSEIDITVKKLKSYYLVNSDEEDELFYKLWLTEGDNQAYQALMENDLTTIKQFKDTKIIENYYYFYDEFLKKNLQMIYNGLKKLVVIDVSLEAGKDNPQLIFESLNSTGLDLSQSDLIRNYILMDLEPKLQSQLYKKYWLKIETIFKDGMENGFDRFSRDYLTIKNGRIPKQDQTYEVFKTYIDKEINQKDIEEVVQDFYEYAQLFSELLYAQTNDKSLNRIISDINELRVNVAYPFLIQVLRDYYNELITIDEVRNIFQTLESYVFRRTILGIPTNSLNKIFANFYDHIDFKHYLDSVLYEFTHLDSYKRFPSDEEFYREIKIKDIYNFQRSKYLLGKLENFDTKEKITLSNYSIEHIMPQTLTDNWKQTLGENFDNIHSTYLNTLGNLTLTGYNSELSNNDFEKKRKMKNGFTYSPIRLNHMLKDINEWNEREIEYRGDILSELALNVWKYPVYSNAYIPDSGIEETVGKNYGLSDYSNANDDSTKLYEKIKTHVMNMDPNIKEKYNKLYIVFKYRSNLVSIIFNAEGLVVNLNGTIDELHDENNLLTDLRKKGHWATGESEIKVVSLEDLPYVFDLINQVYGLQKES